VLFASNPLVMLYMLERHYKDHGGQDCMVMQSRSRVWIMAARRLAKRIQNHCFTFKYLVKCGEQLMASCLPTRWV
jgi:hypothetical protein